MIIRLSAFADEAGENFSDQLAALARNNIPYIEIRNVDGVNVSKLSLDQAADYAGRLKEAGIKVWSIGSPLGKVKVTDDFAEHLALTGHVLAIAKVFGAERVRIFSFFTDRYQQDRAAVLERLNAMAKLADKEGITLAHENEKEIYGDTAERVSDLMANVPGLKSIFDPANYIQVGQNIDAAISTRLNDIEYLHIKDALAATGEITPAGLGEGQIPKLISSALRVKPELVLSLEPHLKVFSGYAAIDSHQLKTKYNYESNHAAFDAAANALKDVLRQLGFKEEANQWIK